MEQSKPVISPMLPRAHVSDREKMINEETSNMMTTLYREAIVALMFLSARTRPDISVAVGTLAMHVQEPRNMD
jgi:ArsR family metal-binding transcriptional regulator